MSKIRFQHFKGGTYQLICTATNSNDLSRTTVVYQAELDGRYWARDAEEFHQLVTWPDGSTQPRFRLIPSEPKS